MFLLFRTSKLAFTFVYSLAIVNISDMPDGDLEESVIDMLACRWERKLAGAEDITKRDLVKNFEEFFLLRYTDNDRIKVRAIIEKISLAAN